MITNDYIYIYMYIHMYRQYMRSISWKTTTIRFVLTCKILWIHHPK